MKETVASTHFYEIYIPVIRCVLYLIWVRRNCCLWHQDEGNGESRIEGFWRSEFCAANSRPQKSANVFPCVGDEALGGTIRIAP